jgi:flagellar biogenesis protein FliO
VANASLGVALARVAIVLGLLWIVMRIIRRVSGRSRGGGASRSARNICTIELLNRRAIGRTASVAAVRVGAKMYVLGITDQRIDKLDECDAPDLDLEAIALSSEFAADGQGDDGLEAPNRSRGLFDPRARKRSSFLDSLRERTVR